MQSRGTSVVPSAALAEVVHTVGIDERDAEAESMPDISLVSKPFVLVRTPFDWSTCTNGGEVMGVSNHGEDPKAIAVGYLVDDDDVPAGAYDASGHPESVLGDGGPGFPFSGSQGEAAGINSSEFVSRWHT